MSVSFRNLISWDWILFFNFEKKYQLTVNADNATLFSVIGIVNSDQDLKYVTNGNFTDEEFGGVGFDAGFSQITNSGEDYGIVCKDDDIIEMELNMNVLYVYVKYIINDKDYGDAFEVEPGNYRAAVYFSKGGNKLRIIAWWFKQNFCKKNHYLINHINMVMTFNPWPEAVKPSALS